MGCGDLAYELLAADAQTDEKIQSNSTHCTRPRRNASTKQREEVFGFNMPERKHSSCALSALQRESEEAGCVGEVSASAPVVVSSLILEQRGRAAGKHRDGSKSDCVHATQGVGTLRTTWVKN